MKTAFVEKLGEKLCFPVERDGLDPQRSSFERFAIPYSFKPHLTVNEAIVAAGGALLRIVLGSILFGVWGAYTLVAWNVTHNPFLRGAAMLGLLLLFAVALTSLMLAISAVVRMLWPQPISRP